MSAYTLVELQIRLGDSKNCRKKQINQPIDDAQALPQLRTQSHWQNELDLESQEKRSNHEKTTKIIKLIRW